MKPVQNAPPSVPAAYLTQQGKCIVSRWEAEATLAWLEDQGVSLDSDPKTMREHFMQRSLQDFRAVVSAYRENAIEEDISPFRMLSAQVCGAPQSKLKKLSPSEEKAFLEQTRRSAPPSAMDFESLRRVEPFGKIEPPLPGGLLLQDELHIPTRYGFIKALQIPSFSPQEPKQLTVSVDGNQNFTRTIEIPFTPAEGIALVPGIVPVPLGHTIRTVERDGKPIEFAPPTKDDPIIVRANVEGQFTFTITDEPGISSGPTIDFEKFRPSEEEQAYLRSILPLPAMLKEALETARSPEDKLNLVTSWLSKPNKKTGLTEFRYACNDRFGDFLQANSEHLPLIMNELKAGHCDLLSWYTATALRAYGVAAWKGNVWTTVPDGSAINGACGHAVVVLERSDGTCGFFDSTRYVRMDPAYHPEALTEARVQSLSTEFAGAGSDNERIAILRKFDAEQNAVRPQFKDVYSDFQSSYQPSSYPRGREIMVEHTPLSWDLPDKATPENLYDVASSIESTFPYTLYHLEENAKNPLWRRNIAWLLNGLKETKCPALYTKPNYYMFERYSDRDGVMTNHNYGFNDAGLVVANHFREDPQVEFTAAIMGCESNVGTVASSFRSRFHPSTEDLFSSTQFRAYHGSRYYSAICNDISAWNLGALAEKNIPSIREHKYSEAFRTILTSIPTIHHLSIPSQSVIDSGSHLPGHVGFEHCSLNGSGSYEPEDPEPRHNIPPVSFQGFCDDVHRFVFDFQFSSLSGQHRREFLNRLGISSQQLRQYALDELSIEDRSIRKIINHPGDLKNSRVNNGGEILIDELFEMVHVSGSCKERVFTNLARTVRAMKFGIETAVVREEYKNYEPGDDLRHVDWNIYARSDQLMVKTAPTKGKDETKVLHVLFETSYPDTKIFTALQHYEILEGLKRLSKSLGLTVYVGSTIGDSYIKLNGVSAKDILKNLWSQGKQAGVGPWLPGKRFPNNFLYVSSHGMTTSAMRHLAFGEKTNMKTLYLDEEPYTIYPLANEKWVNEGFSAKEKFWLGVIRVDRFPNRVKPEPPPSMMMDPFMEKMGHFQEEMNPS